MGLKQDYKFESRALYPELKGKRVVVTGGASGIGKATANRFVLEGSKVVVFDYNDKAFDALKAEIPGLVDCVKVDVSSEESVKAAFAKVLEEAQEVQGALENGRNLAEELGDLLFAVTCVCRLAGLDPDIALHFSTNKFIQRFRSMENMIKTDGKCTEDLTLSEMDVYWNAGKHDGIRV